MDLESAFYGLYDAKQPRKPKGDPSGGQWTSGTGGGAPASATAWQDMSMADRRAAATVTEENGTLVVTGGGITTRVQALEERWDTRAQGSTTTSRASEYLDEMGLNGREFLVDYALMTSGISTDTPTRTVKVVLKQGATRTVRMEIAGGGIQMTRNFMHERTPDGDRIVVDHSFFKLDATGGGNGARMLHDSLEMYGKHKAIQEIELNANIDVGGYAWAKLGFKARDVDNFVEVMTSRAQRKGVFNDLHPSTGRPVLNGDARIAFRQNLKSKGEDAPSWLANLPSVKGLISGKSLMLGSIWDGYLPVGGATAKAVLTRLKSKLAEKKTNAQ